jgi:glycine dehydrogenase subunit 2
MAINAKGRPTAPGATTASDIVTFTGNRGLDHEEGLIFEIGDTGRTGVDLPPAPAAKPRLGGLDRTSVIGLPGLTEPETMRHYVRLSRKNYAIDSGLYPLGSCTMKHNPRLNEKMARVPGIGDIHPLQPQSTVQGAIQLMETLAGYLLELTGMPAVALSPMAGAHGELCGMLAI